MITQVTRPKKRAHNTRPMEDSKSCEIIGNERNMNFLGIEFCRWMAQFSWGVAKHLNNWRRKPKKPFYPPGAARGARDARLRNLLFFNGNRMGGDE